VAGFVTGLLIGLGASLLAATFVGIALYKRVVRLERRARHAERLAELGTLTGGLAHEIKNPLSTVQLNLQLLREDLDPDNPAYSRIVNRLTTVQQETTRLRETLDDFLRYAGRLELDRRPVEMNQLLEELVDFFSPQAHLNRVQLRLKRAAEPVRADVDPKLIKQAILNLMLNGIQAMSQNSPSSGGDMILSVAATDGVATVDIIDTGPGIPPDQLDKIFGAYYSTKKGGTGLGLAMTKRIVDEHGGSLQVTSEPGKGSDFRMQLPLAK
jgi:signal transduction histidine kinase